MPADWIVEGHDQVEKLPPSLLLSPTDSLPQAAGGLTCPASLSGAALEELTVWVDPLDGTAEYTQVGVGTGQQQE